jgi:hypothetical protein
MDGGLSTSLNIRVMIPDRLISAVGLLVLLGLAWLCSTHR